MLFGAPSKRDGTEAILFLPGDRLMMPIYTCASATRAIVKTVDFTYNGTGQLAGLSVAQIEAKDYESEESKPWWSVEITGLPEQEANPIWGFIQPSDRNRPDLVSFQREWLHLPGYQRHDASPYSNLQNLPGVDFHVHAMSMSYGIQASSLAVTYSGDEDLGIFSRWQDLSKDAEGSAKILNLVWTNVAANAVTGTRGWHTQAASANSADDENAGGTFVRKFNRRIHYRWAYGIPAFIVLLLTLLATVISLLLFVLGRGTPFSVKWYLNSTSMGRVYGQFIYPDTSVVQLPTEEWIGQVGVTKVRLGEVAGVNQELVLLHFAVKVRRVRSNATYPPTGGIMESPGLTARFILGGGQVFAINLTKQAIVHHEIVYARALGSVAGGIEGRAVYSGRVHYEGYAYGLLFGK